jgi:hypothetical protein
MRSSPRPEDNSRPNITRLLLEGHGSLKTDAWPMGHSKEKCSFTVSGEGLLSHPFGARLSFILTRAIRPASLLTKIAQLPMSAAAAAKPPAASPAPNERHVRQLRALLDTGAPAGSPHRGWLLSLSDADLNCFLRIERSKVPRAAEALLATAAWRHRHRVDSIARWWPADPRPEAAFIREYWPSVLLGNSHAGLPVMYHAILRVDFKASEGGRWWGCSDRPHARASRRFQGERGVGWPGGRGCSRALGEGRLQGDGGVSG